MTYNRKKMDETTFRRNIEDLIVGYAEARQGHRVANPFSRSLAPAVQLDFAPGGEVPPGDYPEGQPVVAAGTFTWHSTPGAPAATAPVTVTWLNHGHVSVFIGDDAWPPLTVHHLHIGFSADAFAEETGLDALAHRC